MWSLLTFILQVFLLAVRAAFKDNDWSLLLTILTLFGIGYLCKVFG